MTRNRKPASHDEIVRCNWLMQRPLALMIIRGSRAKFNSHFLYRRFSKTGRTRFSGPRVMFAIGRSELSSMHLVQHLLMKSRITRLPELRKSGRSLRSYS